MQAVHDLLTHGADVAKYDHLQFPGVVPRSFVGPLLVAIPVYIIQWCVHLGWSLLDLIPMGSFLSFIPRVIPVVILLANSNGLVGIGALSSRPPAPVPLTDLVPALAPYFQAIANTYSAIFARIHPLIAESPAYEYISSALKSGPFQESPYDSDSATAVLNALLSRSDKLWLQVVTRLVMGTITVLALSYFCSCARRRFRSQHSLDSLLAVILALVFHVSFYASRLLANVFALQCATLAFAAWMNGYLAVIGIPILAFGACVMRCDLVVLAVPLIVATFIRYLLHVCRPSTTAPESEPPVLYDARHVEEVRKRPYFFGVAEPRVKFPSSPASSPRSGQSQAAREALPVPSSDPPRLSVAARTPALALSHVGQGIQASIAAVMVSLALTLTIDSYFWNQRLMWPELRVLLFNTVQNRSHEWGVSPWHWYFTSSLPKSFGPMLLFIPFAFLSQSLLRYIFHILKRFICFDPFILRRARRSQLELNENLHSHELVCRAIQPSFPFIRHWIDIDGTTIATVVFAFVGLYSNLPHKETRFILPGFPLFALVITLSMTKISSAAAEYAQIFQVITPENSRQPNSASPSSLNNPQESKANVSASEAQNQKEIETAVFVHEPSHLWRLFFAVTCGLLFIMSYLGSMASMSNYPGGQALVLLNRHIESILVRDPLTVQELVKRWRHLPQVDITATLKPNENVGSHTLLPIANVTVHLGNLGCISGITRFGEIAYLPAMGDAVRIAGPGLAPMTPRETRIGTASMPFAITYSKEEGLSKEELKARAFDWILTEFDHVPGYTRFAAPIEAFSEWTFVPASLRDTDSDIDHTMKAKLRLALSDLMQWPPKLPSIGMRRAPALYIHIRSELLKRLHESKILPQANTR